MRIIHIAIVLLASFTLLAAASPYSGQQGRDIKSLSAEDVKAYLNGEGMGLARAGELNHYPGPRHVLDLTDKLALSATQVGLIQALYDEMHAAAVPLGARILQDEGRLDQLFSSGTIDEFRLKSLTLAIGEQTGQLRAVHLRAHLATRAVLSQRQIELYDSLRGYSNSAPSPAAHHHEM